MLLVTAVCFTINSRAQVSGVVFRDFNGNGAKDNSASFNEPFVQGITVKATLANGTSFTTTTDAAGAYSFTVGQIPAASAVRIEFSGLGTGDFSSATGSGNGTNVTFVTAPSTTANYAVNAPDDYWNNTVLTDPPLLAVNLRRGTTTSLYKDQYTVVHINNSSTGPYNPADANIVIIDTSKRPATHSQTGSLFGLAVQRKQERFFASATMRRSVGLGPKGAGGVYILDKSGATWALSGSFTLQGVVPANSATALDFGSVTRVTTPATNNNYISDITQWSTGSGSDGRDIDAFSKAGTMAYGDIEADPNSDKIYMVNLFQKRLIVFNASATTATLNGATTATLAPFTNAYDITTLPGCPAPTGAGNNIRPFAVKIYKGKGYLGVVSDAMSTQAKADLKGYILQFDPANITAGFTTVITINFNSYNGTPFNPWVTTWAQTGGTGTTGQRDFPQPMISSIEFNEDGSMDIGIRDRWGDQGGSFEFNPVAGATGHTQCSVNGDLLHACWNGSVWALEGTPGSCVQPAANTNAAGSTNSFGSGNSFGTTGKEWYADRSGDGGNENGLGGLAKLMGTGKMVSSVYDPMGQGENSAAVDGGGSGVYWSSQGVQWSTVTSGVKSQVARIQGGASNSLDKSNGMGDIEFLAQAQPIEVGNRIWTDTNGDGIQDAGEAGIGSLAVTLRSPGVDGIFGNADDQTWSTTTDASGNYYFKTLSSADNRKPANWTGIGNLILPGYDYRIEVTTPAGTQLTKSNAGSNGYDNIDNDATLNGSTAIVTFNTSNTNHNFDIGFKTLASLGDKVWRDDNKNGIQDTGEPGVAGVTVTLYNNAGSVIATTITDAYGIYLFDNLAAATYQVGFTPPSNYTFTTQTNNNDNGTLTGGSTAANGSDVSSTTGRTANVVLTAGEAERNIDAGLIFSQPLTASVGDKIWLDANSNGVQDASEAGVAGVTVTLYDNTGAAIATTVTDANGNYLFTGLAAGTYSVGFTLPAGTNFTGKDLGGDDNTDSDVNTSGVNFGKTDNFTLASGEAKTNVDAGVVLLAATTASLGDKVWIDVTGGTANVQDANEPGLAGVTVNLYRDANGDGIINGAEATTPIATTVTDGFGNYIFNNLTPAVGSTAYRVKFTLPSGYTFVTAGIGGDETKDSDANPADGLSAYYFLFPGQRNLTLDAGVTQNSPAGTARLGDKVWFDANSNGVQDATETGVAGVTVTLYNNLGVAIATTATDVNGNYQFINLAAGNYSVGFSNLPNAYSFTTIWSSDDTNATNSDANPGTGKTGTITLSVGESEQDVDAGLIAGVSSGLGSIGNKVWWDIVNNNNIQDAGEPGVQGVTVNLYADANGDGLINGAEASTPYATTTTNAIGEYIFTGLPAGTYQVGFTNLPTGSNTVTQNSGTNDALDSDGSAVTNATGASVSSTALIILASGEDNLTVDLGVINTAKASLGNRVWFDNGAGGGTANDGIQNGTESGVAGVMVTLVNAAGQTVDKTGALTATPVTTTTDASGYYAFADLTAGVSFAVRFTNLPAGFDLSVKSGTGGGDDNKSDPDLISGLTPAITTVANTFNATLDGGITSTRAALGNYVWLDTNGDGTQLFDGTEPGVAGVTVTLYRPGFGLDGVASTADDALPVATMITDQNGQYLFSNLVAGTYQVEFTTAPGGLLFTKQNTPGDNGDDTNSDAVPVAGKPTVGLTTNIVLSNGEADLTIDAGLFKPRAVIGNFVWSDKNGNGLQDSGEPGVGGVVVRLIDALGNVVAVCVTDANGAYLFPNVAPGTYSMSFTNLPNGVTFTTSNVGANDNIDSDVVGTTITGITVTTTTNNLSFDAGLVGVITLPARLEFTALKQGQAAKLTWKVTQEENVAQYVLEHSANGINYNSINTQTRNGSVEYSYLDLQPANGINYYRVRIVDVDGRITYSDIKTVIFGKSGLVLLFPNPAKSEINVMIPESWQGKMLKIELYNQAGQMVLSKMQPQASQVEAISVSLLARGIYTVRLQNANGDIEVKQAQLSN